MSEASTSVKPTEYPFAGESYNWPRAKRLAFEAKTREAYAAAFEERAKTITDEAKLSPARRKYPQQCESNGSLNHPCECAHCYAARAVAATVKELTGYDHTTEKPTK